MWRGEMGDSRRASHLHNLQPSSSQLWKINDFEDPGEFLPQPPSFLITPCRSSLPSCSGMRLLPVRLRWKGTSQNATALSLTDFKQLMESFLAR